MASILSRFLPGLKSPEPLTPGIYHWMTPPDADPQVRLHLRVEPDGDGVLVINAAVVAHLNQTATAHALQIIEGASPEKAAQSIADRYRVSREQALQDHEILRDQVFTIATKPDLDPILFLDIERMEPYQQKPSAPYRMDLALTYRIDEEGGMDPLARKRVDRELTTEEWVAILDAAWEASIPHVTFTGGEPTLRKDLTALIQHAEATGMVTGLLTDGRRLADATYLHKLAMTGLDHILIALDLDDEASRSGLKIALDSDVYTAVHLTLRSEAFSELESGLRELAAQGVPAVSLAARESTEPFEERLLEARELAADLGMDLIWDLPVPYSKMNPINAELEAPPEGAGRAWLYVEPDGDVLPGQGSDRILGNFLRDTWSEIWSAA
jgi:MoaA/NifB/PqqE/SkfB family radical SAM enzyme